jgi:predicted protein tyrosine phosphatase
MVKTGCPRQADNPLCDAFIIVHPLYLHSIITGKVLIHCVEGISRSATIAIAYLMTHEHLTAQQAMREVRGGREVCPNQGFLLQLCQYNDTLTRARHFEGKGS